MEDLVNEIASENHSENDDSFVFQVEDGMVMQSAINVMEQLGKMKKVVLKGEGDTIPNAVAIANILVEKFLKGNSTIEKILVDSEIDKESGRLISNVEIILLKS